jgi:L-cystine transport system substrate-binding protein
MKKFKVMKLLTVATLIGVLLTACGANKTSSEATKSNPKTVIIGTGNAFKPYCYLDANGKPAGYEINVLKEVNKRLPQYKFQFQPMDFTNVLLSLQSGKVDVGAHQFEKNPEREQKFLFSNESYTTFILRITDLKNRTDINSIDDLKGKKVQVGKGSNDAYTLEQYNKTHGDAIKLVYSSADIATTIKSLEAGDIDAFISVTRLVEQYNKTFGDKLKTVGSPISSSSTYYLYRKSDTTLQKDIDKALKAMKADGTLEKISKETLGGDYTHND